MDTYTIYKELDRLYQELDVVHRMSEKAVCEKYNADNKKEIVQVITDDIDRLEDEMKEIEEMASMDDDCMDYINLQLSQGMPVIHW